MKTRAEYEANSLSRTQPWKAENISRAEWYRRRTKAETSLAAIKLTTVSDRPVPTGLELVEAEEIAGRAGLVSRPPLKPALPDLSNFNPILSWLCLRAAYHQRMNKICDQAANAKAA
jgi:hypothetical protein